MNAPRPRWHFTPCTGWINDPLAVTWHDGVYHLFFQYVPDSVEWAAQCRWGHATSPDLAHWTEQPVALEPAADETGAWSGDLVIDDDGAPRMFYTSVGPGPWGDGRIRLATMINDWSTWVPAEVMATAPASLEAIDFRDPFVVRTADGWRMVVGVRLPDSVAALVGFSSPDLAEWTYDGVLASRSADDHEGSPTGSMWECPQLIEIDSRLTLIVSVWDRERLTHVAAAPVVWVGDRMDVGEWQTLSYGNSYYAATAFTDEDGNACLIYWLREVTDRTAGWAGAHSVPHVLRWQNDRIVAAPHPNVVAAAGTNWHEFVPSNALTDTSFGAIQLLDGRLQIDRPGSAPATLPYVGGAVGVLTDEGLVEIFTAAGVTTLSAAG